jgi:ribose/xylose/arabinose/galactoside ABC-type transport system permease subunit
VCFTTALVVLYAFVTTRTVIGRQIYAVGGNAKAAKLSGIKTERLAFRTFVNMACWRRLKPRAGRTSAIAAAYSVSEPSSLSNMTASTMKLPTNVPCQNASTPSSRRLLRITSISVAPMTAAAMTASSML